MIVNVPQAVFEFVSVSVMMSNVVLRRLALPLKVGKGRWSIFESVFESR